ncbi:MAG: amidase domain-containing protein [Oscillospiraceae bacterium]|nr:amidase domain-containing protein [Oscillospiraceae bacterium]
MYNREAAISYAHKFAFSRNPDFLDFHGIGGDCTNFISQCIHAGGAQMNYTPDLGWYYRNGYDKAPGWTGVQYLYNFLVSNRSEGPYATETDVTQILPGDVVQLSFDGQTFGHSLFVVAAGKAPRPGNILVATHSQDSDNRRLTTYTAAVGVRYIHILGAR